MVWCFTDPVRICNLWEMWFTVQIIYRLHVAVILAEAVPVGSCPPEKKELFTLIILTCSQCGYSFGQPNWWQQKIEFIQFIRQTKLFLIYIKGNVILIQLSNEWMNDWAITDSAWSKRTESLVPRMRTKNWCEGTVRYRRCFSGTAAITVTAEIEFIKYKSELCDSGMSRSMER